MSLHKTAEGPAVFRLDENLKRLERTAELLKMTLPMSGEDFKRAVFETIRGNQVESGFVKLMCYYGKVAIRVMPNQKIMDTCIAVIDPETDMEGEKLPARPELALVLCGVRKLHPETIPIEAKAAANYLNGILSRKEAVEKGADMGVMLDTQGFIAEGSTESIFIVKSGILYTPSLGTVLRSISRKSVLEVAAAVGIPSEEKRLPPSLLFEADEIFLSSTGGKVQPVKRFEDKIFSEVPGPVTQRIKETLDKIVNGSDPRFPHWLVREI
jgi:branched-chain amino acid aminotransferase